MAKIAEIEKYATPEEVRTARESCGTSETQELAASRVYLERRTWQDYEGGQRRMLRAVLELYLIKTKRIRAAEEKRSKRAR